MHIKSLCCIMAPPRQGTDISLPLSPPNICSQPMTQSCTMQTSKLLDFAFANKLILSFDQIIFTKLWKKLLSSYNQARLSPKITPLSKEWNGHQIPTESDHQCFLHILAKMVLDALILEAFIFSSRRLKHFFLQTIDEPNILEG